MMYNKSKFDISVIIPVYNGEEFIEKCISSIVKQKINSEIILIDDGSTDNSIQILTTFENRFENIKLIRQKNKYAGIARNAGLNEASGEFVHFVDVDDTVCPNCYENLLKFAKINELDYIKVRAHTYDIKSGEMIIDGHYCLSYSLDELDKNLFNRVFEKYDNFETFLYLGVAPWSGICRREFLVDNGIRFNGLKRVNDRSFYMQVISNSSRKAIFDEYVVNHQINNPCSLAGGRKKGEDFDCCIESIHQVERVLEGVPQKIKNRIIDLELKVFLYEYLSLNPEIREKYKDIIKAQIVERYEKTYGFYLNNSILELRRSIFGRNEYSLCIDGNFRVLANTIYEKLLDNESRHLFDIRYDYFINRDKDRLFMGIWDMYDDWRFVFNAKTENILSDVREGVICGCGHDGRLNHSILKKLGFNTLCFCDKKLYGNRYDGRDILTITEAVEKYPNKCFVISSSKYSNEILNELITAGISKNNIYIPQNKYVYMERGKPYFDCFEAEDEEIFVDCGAHDGKACIDFFDWMNNGKGKVYAFEPIGKMYNLIEQVFADDLRVKTYCNAVWDIYEETTIIIKSDSQEDHNGNIQVEAIDLDSVLKDEKITFIKMDINGAELKGLIGARRLIEKNHPKLAICVDRKPKDILEVPMYILQLYEGYRFYIRHYTSCHRGTIMYAIPND